MTGRPDHAVVVGGGLAGLTTAYRYDLDIEAQKVADEVGLAFARTRVLNDDPTVFAALADRVIAAVPA